jgi:hypothetical protein
LFVTAAAVKTAGGEVMVAHLDVRGVKPAEISMVNVRNPLRIVVFPLKLRIFSNLLTSGN